MTNSTGHTFFMLKDGSITDNINDVRDYDNK